ncbi:MAG: hypothetical protein EOM34_08620 [Clostridia bacterium]|nr:hypothetical protein [Lachnospiraceae bacterium]NCC00730.1 hypothetical protein [Clostridia bacterium]NCD04285.1 hypothetical protein [Clostridia bacterium]
MSLLMISEIMQEKQEPLSTLSDYEKEFVVQFAFKTLDQELTNKLIQELAEARDGDETKQIMELTFKNYASIVKFMVLR